jgi:protein-S-isoprenylcysteine O-methyltransferase
MAENGHSAIFDGKHTSQNIATYAFLLGTVFGVSLTITIIAEGEFKWLGTHLTALTLFHLLEYLCTAIFNAPNLALDSYLIPHSAGYVLANVTAMSEYAIRNLFMPNYDFVDPSLRLLGLVMVLIGQTVRSFAMAHAGSNFNHNIETSKKPGHSLVTTGIYSVLRHPAYFGFFWWGIGQQLILGNQICLIAHTIVLIRFFRGRIKYEERFLESFFDTKYKEYRKCSWIGIPFC